MTYEIPGVLIRHPPQDPMAPVVFDSPHSGTLYPDDMLASVPMPVLRRGEDTYVDELYAAAPEHGAPLLTALFPRSYIDPNRDLLDIDGTMLEEPWPGPVAPGDKTETGVGLIWRLVGPEMPLYDRKLAVAEVRNRIDRYWRPYHEALRQTLDDVHERFGAVWHVNCHSMFAVGNELSPDTGQTRADFVLGDRDGSTCEGAFTLAVAEWIAEMGYSVKINDPYKGVELVRRYSDPRARRHSLQIEVKRSLYMDEDTLVKTRNFPRLQADIGRLIRRICDYAAEAAR